MGFISTLSALLGAGIALTTGYLVVRGPFLGGPGLEPFTLLGMAVGFIVGLQLSAWGLARHYRSAI